MVQWNLSKQLMEAIASDPLNKSDNEFFVQELRKYINWYYSSRKDMPIDIVLWVPIDKVQANDYNPNSVAKNEMKLLYTSIAHDGLTQPIVTVYDAEIDKYVIVDGFHRYTTMRLNPDLQEKTGGCVPIVVIQKDINDRMASTVRHNRARGKHSTGGMANMIFSMLDEGWTDEMICAELGMEAEELLRLKHITGFSKLFADTQYQKAWETKNQLIIQKNYMENGTEKTQPDGDKTVLA